MTKGMTPRNWALVAAVVLVGVYLFLASMNFLAGINGAAMLRPFSLSLDIFPLFLIALGTWVIPVVLIVWAVQKVRSSGVSHRSIALDIAAERYARGEIDREQFEEIRDTIAKA